ncbi:MAG: ABC transporter permease [Bacteroidota bacterium]
MQVTTAVRQPGAQSGTVSFVRRLTRFREFTLLLIIIGLGAILSALSPHFLTWDNLLPTAKGLSADGIVAIGMTVALVLGGFDLSVGSVLALAGVVAGGLYLAGFNIWLASAAALLTGMFCGLINGYFIGRVGLNPLITTLGMMGIARGAAYVCTQGSPLSLSGTDPVFLFLGSGSVLGVPVMVLILAVLAVLGDFLLRRSTALRKVFYVGSNEKAAVLSGINVKQVKLWVYFLVASLSALAGLLSLSRFTVAQPNAATGAELRAISSCVIGGASLSGGEGTILGSILGVILLALVNNGLVLLNVSMYWQDLISGVILIGAVTIDYVTHRTAH